VGTVRATSVVVEGEVTGGALEAQRVEIGATARVRADVHAGRVAIAEGGVFEGKVRMGGAAEAASPLVFREKRGAPREDDDARRT
jgi:cytoskeletal protein CcmA (bactofilin family)